MSEQELPQEINDLIDKVGNNTDYSVFVVAAKESSLIESEAKKRGMTRHHLLNMMFHMMIGTLQAGAPLPYLDAHQPPQLDRFLISKANRTFCIIERKKALKTEDWTLQKTTNPELIAMMSTTYNRNTDPDKLLKALKKMKDNDLIRLDGTKHKE